MATASAQFPFTKSFINLYIDILFRQNDVNIVYYLLTKLFFINFCVVWEFYFSYNYNKGVNLK